MNVQLKKSYAEVGEILNVLGETYKSKLPKALLNIFEVSAQETSDIFINQYSDFETVDISREALIIISILNLKYWEDDPEEIERLKKKYEENEIKYRESIMNNFTNNTKVKNDFIENRNDMTELVVSGQNTFWDKIKNFFVRLLKRQKVNFVSSKELFEQCPYSIEELEQFRDENGYIDLIKAGVAFPKDSREIVRKSEQA